MSSDLYLMIMQTCTEAEIISGFLTESREQFLGKQVDLMNQLLVPLKQNTWVLKETKNSSATQQEQFFNILYTHCVTIAGSEQLKNKNSLRIEFMDELIYILNEVPFEYG